MTQVDKKANKANSGGQGSSAKKASGKSDHPPAPAAHDSEEVSRAGSAVEASANKAAHVEGAHGGAAKGHHRDHAAQIREYFIIFGVLFVLTILEVAVAQVPGIGKTALVVALIGLALTKAAIVALFYMHLKHETRILRLTVALPMVVPAIYAVVLIGEAAWRLTR